MASYVFRGFKEDVMRGNLSLNGASDVKVKLISDGSTLLTATTDNSGTEAQDLRYLSEVTTLDECTGVTNYTEQTLSSVTVTYDATDNEGVLDAADAAFGTIGGASNDTVAGALVYRDDAGGDAASELLCYLELGSSYLTDGSDVTLQFNAEGIINLT